MNGRVLRVIDEYEHRWRYVAAGLLVLAVFALVAAGYAYVNAPTEQVVTETSAEQSQFTVETKATVTENTQIYDKGEVVRNSPIYVLDTMPRATVMMRTDLPPETQDAQVTTTAFVVLTASHNGVTFWQERHTVLDEHTVHNTAGPVSVNATVPIAYLRGRGLAIQKMYHHRGHVSMRLVTRSTYRSDSYSGTLRAAMPIQVDDKTYSIGRGRAATTKSHTDVSTAQRPLRFKYAGPLLILAAVLGVLSGGAVVTHRLADGSRTEWDYELRQFDEWISRGTVTVAEPAQVVEEESIGDLVDVAIDSGHRVVYDTDKQACIVLADTAIHYVTREDSPWTPQRADW